MRSIAFVAALVAPVKSAPAASWFDDGRHALPCRPTIACTADLVPPGSIEIEIGYLFRKLHPPALQHSVPFLVKLTLAEWVQFQIGGNGPTFANAPVPTRYVDDIVAGFKFHLSEQSKWMPSLSWSVTMSIPLAAAPGYVRTYDMLWTAYMTKDFAWLHADLNLGLNLWQLEGPTKAQPWAALAFSVELPRHFTVMAENYYFLDASPIAPQDGGLLIGLAFAPKPWIVFDLGGDLGYVQAQRSVSAFVGMTLLPVDLWQTRPELAKHPREQ